jgi:hypothetical protein
MMDDGRYLELATLEARKLPGLERRYPVLGPPSSRFADRKQDNKV